MCSAGTGAGAAAAGHIEAGRSRSSGQRHCGISLFDCAAFEELPEFSFY